MQVIRVNASVGTVGLVRLSDLRRNSRWQFRQSAFSERTVQAIVEHGFDAARFDPIPVFRSESGQHWMVAGDGHSRLEAVRRLHVSGAGPEGWEAGCVLVRVVQRADALRLAHTANMSREPFSDVEEGRIFKARLEEGESLADIASTSHRSASYVRRRVSLTVLCGEIQADIGQAYGMTAELAMVLGEAVERFGIDHAQQSQLYRKVLTHGDWTTTSLKAFLATYGARLTESGGGPGFLFELPANVGAAIEDATRLAQDRRRVKRGLMWLHQSLDGLAEFPELLALLKKQGEAWIEKAKVLERGDVAVVASLAQCRRAKGAA